MDDRPNQPDMAGGGDAYECVRRALAYHRRSKYRLHRYADSPGALDWATQPDPFRTFAGAAVNDLPPLAGPSTISGRRP